VLRHRSRITSLTLDGRIGESGDATSSRESPRRAEKDAPLHVPNLGSGFDRVAIWGLLIVQHYRGRPDIWCNPWLPIFLRRGPHNAPGREVTHGEHISLDNLG
jgi:hypothetical protein